MFFNLLVDFSGFILAGFRGAAPCRTQCPDFVVDFHIARSGCFFFHRANDFLARSGASSPASPAVTTNHLKPTRIQPDLDDLLIFPPRRHKPEQ